MSSALDRDTDRIDDALDEFRRAAELDLHRGSSLAERRGYRAPMRKARQTRGASRLAQVQTSQSNTRRRSRFSLTVAQRRIGRRLAPRSAS
jgi:hypothetical protein